MKKKETFTFRFCRREVELLISGLRLLSAHHAERSDTFKSGDLNSPDADYHHKMWADTVRLWDKLDVLPPEDEEE